MTAAQKTAKAKFKKAIAYRQKTGVSLKEAFAHIYGKKVGAAVKKRVGALPIGFKGSIYDIPFKIVNQYDIYNDVSAIMEDTNNGNRIVAFDGKGVAKDKAEAIVSYISKITNVSSYKNDKELYRRMLKFATNMQKEVKDFNAGKKKTIKKEPLKIVAPKNIVTTKKRLPSVIKLINKTIDKVYKKSKAKKSAPKKKAARKVIRKAAPKKVAKKKLTSRDYDKRYQALRPGKRVSESGNIYYENRANRSDRGKLLGIKIGNIPTYKDKDAAREIQLFADNDYMLYQQRKRPILINLGKKYKKGTYDVNKAAKLWRYYVDAALQKYHKEYGHRGNWYDMLSVPDRNLLSLDYAIETKNEFDLGNFTN